MKCSMRYIEKIEVQIKFSNHCNNGSLFYLFSVTFADVRLEKVSLILVNVCEYA